MYNVKYTINCWHKVYLSFCCDYHLKKNQVAYFLPRTSLCSFRFYIHNHEITLNWFIILCCIQLIEVIEEHVLQDKPPQIFGAVNECSGLRSMDSQ